MSNTKIDLNIPVTRDEFQKLTNKMLEARREYSNLKTYEKEIKISDYVKPQYESTQYIEEYRKEIISENDKLDGIVFFVMRIICLIGYIAFLILFPITTVVDIGFRSYLYIVPLVMLVVLSINNLICKDINTLSGLIYMAFTICGIIIPIVSLFFMASESPGNNVALIGYMIAAFPQIIVSLIISWSNITYNIVQKRHKNIEKEAWAKTKDRAAEEQMRLEDEQKYHEALEHRQKAINKRDETIESWKQYESLYSLWEGKADFAILMYDNVFKARSIPYTISKMNGMIDYFRGEKRLPVELIQSAVERAREENERINRSMQLADEVAAEFSEFLTGHK